MNNGGKFIIGTGRCGSTILSRMIDLHPSTAVLSEMMVALDFERKLGQRVVSGEELGSIIDCGIDSGSGEFKKIVTHLATPEVVYEGGATNLPPDASNYRDNVFPDVLLIPLAHLFEDPATVYNELLIFARAQPDRLLSDQYQILFDWLTRKAGKSIWIERSGGSISILQELIELFPDAQYLHLYRNPLDVALSMQRHNHFRLRAFCHNDLETHDGIRWRDLDENDLNNTLPISPKLKAVLDHPVPLEYFLQDASNSILRGMRAIKHLSPRQYCEISFEQLMADPISTLTEIADFFKLEADPDWLQRAAALLKPGQAAHATANDAQRALLQQYSQSTMTLLEQVPQPALYR